MVAVVRSRLRDGQFRAGIDLVSSSAIGALLGFLFWIVAARTFDEATVGANAVLISSISLVASLSSLGLRNALVRFLPTYGRRSAWLVRRAYGLTGVTTVLLGTVTAAVLADRFDELTLLDSAGGFAFFVAACVITQIFMLQDSVLVATEATRLLPVEAGSYALAKLLALPLFALVFPIWGLFVSWVIPLLAVVVVVNVIIFVRLRRTSAAPATSEVLGPMDLARFSVGEYAGSIVWMGLIGLLPIVVLDRAGDEASAFYTLSWTIVYNLYLVSSNIGTVLLAEAALRPARLAAQSRAAMTQMAMLVVPGATVGLIVAPYLLRIFGSSYSDEGTTLLRLLILASVVHIPVALFVGIVRARRRVTALVAMYTVLAAIVLALSFTLIGPYGVTGVGIAWLAAESVIALAVLGTTLRPVVIGLLPTTAVRTLGALLGTRHRRRARQRTSRVLPDVFRDSAGALAFDVLSVSSDLTVVRVDRPEGEPAILKIASSPTAATQVAREEDVLAELQADDVLGAWRSLIGTVLDRGAGSEAVFSVQSMMTGLPAPASGHAPDDVVAGAFAAIAPLHARYASQRSATEELLQQLVDRPLDVVLAHGPDHATAIERLRAELRDALRAETVVVSRIHGDYSPANVLFAPDEPIVTGIVDWELSEHVGLPETDHAQFLLALDAETQGEELGVIVAQRLRRPSATGDLAGPDGTTGPNRFLDGRQRALLAWTHHVAGNLAKSEGYARNEVWWTRNVEPVLSVVTTAPPPALEPDLSRLPVRVEPAARGRRRPRWPELANLVAFGSGAGLTIAGVIAVDQRAMTDIGLVSALPVSALAGAAVMVVSATVAMLRQPFDGRRAAGYLTALLGVVYATPSIAYETLRFSWAYKHVGIVDYVLRTGTVDPTIDVLPVYHNWPGFFTGAASVTELAGLRDALGIATWAPVAVNLLTLLALVYCLRQLTDSPRTVWLAALIFFTVNWIGQDYFAPQALAFVLYLVTIGTVLRFYRRRSAPAPTLAIHLVLLTTSVALASSHQLTPLILIGALLGLTLLRQARASIPVTLLVVAVVGWAVGGAFPFVRANFVDELNDIGSPVSNAAQTLQRAVERSDGQVLVALAGRGLLVAVGLVAAVGMIRRWQAGDRDVAPYVLLAAPLGLVVLEFGGEILFRVALFMLPVLSLFAASALVSIRHGIVRGVATVLFVTLAFATFGVAYFGKDSFYTFTAEELALVDDLMTGAPPNSLLIEGSRNYPTQFVDYDKFDYVPVEREPLDTQLRLAANPADEFHRWLDNDAYDATFLLITRSQQAEAEALGSLPADFLPNVEQALRSDPRFVVHLENSDAVVFTVITP